MFWPFVLPFEITSWLFLGGIVLAIVYALKSKRTTWKVIVSAVGLALVGFIPSCLGIEMLLNDFRFGHFHHATFDEVKDFRIERYLPTKSHRIDLFKNHDGSGYCAKYQINETDLKDYLDDMWQRWGQYSVVSRADLKRSKANFSDLDLRAFSKLGWSIQGDVEIYRSPIEPDGGGATYYFSAETGVTLQEAYYW